MILVWISQKKDDILIETDFQEKKYYFPVFLDFRYLKNSSKFLIVYF